LGATIQLAAKITGGNASSNNVKGWAFTWFAQLFLKNVKLLCSPIAKIFPMTILYLVRLPMVLRRCWVFSPTTTIRGWQYVENPQRRIAKTPTKASKPNNMWSLFFCVTSVWKPM